MMETIQVHHPERIVVVGIPGAGKTTWVKRYIDAWIKKHGYRVLIVDVLGEYDTPGTIYRPVNRTEPREEIELLVENALINPYLRKDKKLYGLVVFDEGSRYILPRTTLGAYFGYINDFSRHMDLSMIVVARRYSQIHTDMAELAHRHVIFRQTGVNDLRRLAELKHDLDTEVLKLRGHEHVEYMNGEIKRYK